MNSLKLARQQTIEDMKKYLKRVPKEQRLEWLKDGEEWLKEYEAQNSRNTDVRCQEVKQI